MVLCDGNLPYLYSITWREFPDENNRYYLVAFCFCWTYNLLNFPLKPECQGDVQEQTKDGNGSSFQNFAISFEYHVI